MATVHATYDEILLVPFCLAQDIIFIMTVNNALCGLTICIYMWINYIYYGC